MPLPLAAAIDDELAMVQYLCSIPAISTLCASGSISTEMPTKPTYPRVLITRVSGQLIWPALDEPVQVVDVYGTTKRQAKTLALTVRAAILAIANDSVTEGVLSSAVEEVGPQWLPDTLPTPPVPRYTSRYRAVTHPH